MASAVYLRSTDGGQNLTVFKDYATLDEIRQELEIGVQDNGMIVEDFLVSTTRGDRFYSDLEAVAQDILVWSQS